MIPVFEPYLGSKEIEYVTDAVRQGEISGSFGNYIPAFENAFAKYIGCKYGIAVTSGTTALHLAVAAAGIGKGDEVLISASTNIATALAVIHNNAIPVPVDSEPDTWNLDLELIEQLITPRTKAVIAVHLFGHPVDMDKLSTICKKHNLVLIEDCAESHGATCRGKMTGSFGDMSCFSFYANKIITTGEGGMIVTDNKEFNEKLRLLRNLAFTKPRFRHEVAGYNFRMTGMQAALGLAQIEKIEEILQLKIRVAKTYNNYLDGIEYLKTPAEKEWAKNVYWMYAITIAPHKKKSRDGLASFLMDAGIETRTFFCPMNIQPCILALDGFVPIKCSVAEEIWETGLYLPSSPTLTEETILLISGKIKEYLNA